MKQHKYFSAVQAGLHHKVTLSNLMLLLGILYTKFSGVIVSKQTQEPINEIQTNTTNKPIHKQLWPSGSKLVSIAYKLSSSKNGTWKSLVGPEEMFGSTFIEFKGHVCEGPAHSLTQYTPHDYTVRCLITSLYILSVFSLLHTLFGSVDYLNRAKYVWFTDLKFTHQTNQEWTK